MQNLQKRKEKRTTKTKNFSQSFVKENEKSFGMFKRFFIFLIWK
jgi:hypothetical protein